MSGFERGQRGGVEGGGGVRKAVGGRQEHGPGRAGAGGEISRLCPTALECAGGNERKQGLARGRGGFVDQIGGEERTGGLEAARGLLAQRGDALQRLG